jgi:RNA polymerase sigma factor (sigma-70 family)
VAHHPRGAVDPGQAEAAPEFDDLVRELAPEVLGILFRRHGDFAACEDAVQEALLAASVRWPADGLPDSPRGWLLTVASRRLIDEVRSEAARRRREDVFEDSARRLGGGTGAAGEPAVAAPADAGAGSADDLADDSLALLFLCCHPALTPPSQIALTLRAVGGLTTAQIAAAFLTPEATMAQRISRAKQSIDSAGRTFSLPSGTERAQRLAAVLQVLYLVFNEGYTASAGEDLTAPDLTDEAIRLARLLHRLVPDDAEASGLLALMLLTDARRAARVGPEGDLITLDAQDRSLWDQKRIAEGVTLLEAALRTGSTGPYQLQAAIAAVHDEAPDPASTDWPQILGLYDLLAALAPNPMTELNRAVAVAMVRGPEAGLAIVDALADDKRLARHHRLVSVRAYLRAVAGDVDGAVSDYRLAASLTDSAPEQRFLLSRSFSAADVEMAGPTPTRGWKERNTPPQE